MSDIALSSASDATIGDYFSLLKPRVMSLVIFTGFAGMWVAPGFADTHPAILFSAVLSLALGAGAAGAINMWYDRDIDALMNRTRLRAVPTGRVVPEEALGFGLVLSVLSVLTMSLTVNWIAGGILAFSIFFYAVVYTMLLKRSTPQNIVIGGAAGAFPPVIGWASVTGDVTVLPILLFLIIFFWTPPHFWALSLFASGDYKRANIPMLPCVAGERATKIQMLAYCFVLIPVALGPYLMGGAGFGYGIFAFILSVFFLFTAARVYMDDTEKSARLMFGYSVFYLFAIFTALMVDAAR